MACSLGENRTPSFRFRLHAVGNVPRPTPHGLKANRISDFLSMNTGLPRWFVRPPCDWDTRTVKIGSSRACKVIVRAGMRRSNMWEKRMIKRALIVIDVQMEYFTGALPITHPKGHLERILQVFDAARAAKLPVAIVRHHQPNADSPIFRRGSAEWELHPEIAKRTSDILIDKSLPGCFTETPLSDWLSLHGVRTLTIAGYMTHMCCDTTARQGMHRDFKVEFLSDATGTLSVSNSAGSATAEELHRSTLCAQQMMISEVLSSDAWLDRL